jgi:DNA integrity scanning protein DisA with diadenylate cyclase activity
MLLQNTIFVSDVRVYNFYETNKPQVIKIDSKLLDLQLENLIKNDEDNLANFLLVRDYLRNIDIFKPKLILDKYDSLTDTYFEEENKKLYDLLYDAQRSGCLKTWS